VRLLPVYDEYLIAYRDREAVPHRPSGAVAISPGSMTFQHALVIRGQVAGTWRFARTARSVAVDVLSGGPLTEADRRGVMRAAAHFARFLGTKMALSIDTPAAGRTRRAAEPFIG